MQRGRPYRNWKGRRLGNLLVTHHLGKDSFGEQLWAGVCKCGVEVSMNYPALRAREGSEAVRVNGHNCPLNKTVNGKYRDGREKEAKPQIQSSTEVETPKTPTDT